MRYAETDKMGIVYYAKPHLVRNRDAPNLPGPWFFIQRNGENNDAFLVVGRKLLPLQGTRLLR